MIHISAAGLIILKVIFCWWLLGYWLEQRELRKNKGDSK